jgi:predicted amidohydrolase
MMRVAAIQLSKSAPTASAFFDHTSQMIERAVDAGAQLIAMPNTCLTIAPASFIDFFAALAQRLRVFIAPGTIIERDAYSLYNTVRLFAPDGTLVGTQRQTHRSPQEISDGLAQGDELNVFDIGIARVGFVIGTDVEYPEVARILALQGANVLIHPASYAVWRKEHFLTDLWREVQSNQVFGVQACFGGKSAIYAPVEMTSDQRGFLAQAASIDGEEIVSATLDFDALQKVIDAYPIFDFFNYEFYQREFPHIYHASRITNRLDVIGVS